MPIKFKKIIYLVGVCFLFSACSMFQKKVDPTQVNTTQSGFRFKFPMAGDWHEGPAARGEYTVGQKGADGVSSKMAIVRHSPIVTPAGQPMTHKEMLDGFKKQIEIDSEGGRVSKVKSHFAQKKYRGADCLMFDQVGVDNSPKGPMNMSNDGMICLHPTRPYTFIWMGISERWPLGKTASATYQDDKKRFLQSLEFTN